MSEAEKFIKENTRNCSQLHYNSACTLRHCITPDQAIRAVEIAREEVLNDMCEWIEENIGEYCDGENIMFSATHMENIDIFGQERFIKDLKRAMKDG